MIRASSIVYSLISLVAIHASIAVVHAENKHQETIRNQSEFTWDIFHAIGNHKDNTVLSPLGIYMSLAIVYIGSSGETEKSIAMILRNRESKEELLQRLSSLKDDLCSWCEFARAEDDREIKSKPYELNILTSLWCDNRIKCRESFIDVCDKILKSNLMFCDFRDSTSGTIQRINDWVKIHSKEKITGILNANDTLKDAKLLIVNAVYFKSRWHDEFDETMTRERKFNVTNTRTVNSFFMRRGLSDPMMIYDGEEMQALEIPYREKAFSMIVILPRKVDGLFEIEKNIGSLQLEETIRAMKPRRVILHLPKFRIETTIDLRDVLSKMGAGSVFESSAELSEMADKPLFLSRILQKTSLTVSESGTEVVAATDSVVILSAEQEPVPFIADRPFLFLIRENKTGTILFVGRVTNPS